MPEFDDYFPTARYGTNAINVMNFGAFGDNTGHTMGELFPGDLTAAQAAYPSATSLNDTADWCAITEAFKAAFTTGGTPHGSATNLNKPVCFPAGQYVVRKPLIWQGIAGAHIYGLGGMGGVYITNDNTAGTPAERIAVRCNGLRHSRIEGITFQSLGPGASYAFDLNSDNSPESLVSTNGDVFIDCGFSAPGGIGCGIGDGLSPLPGGYMSSEMTFIHCEANNCDTGWHINNFNALNYNFLACGGTYCREAWLLVSAVGMIVVQNASLAGNGDDVATGLDAGGWDIKVGSGTAAILGSRSESRRFVKANGPTSIISCAHNFEGNDNIFCDINSPVYIFGSSSNMGRLTGEGPVTMDGCAFGNTTAKIISIANSGGFFRINHADSGGYASHGIEYFLDGDEVRIENVRVTGGALSVVNGVWRITKIDHDTVDLPLAFVSETYTTLGVSGAACIGPGPRYHLRDNLVSIGSPSKVKVSAVAARQPQENITASFTQLLWADAGKVITNDGAIGAVTIRLPSIMGGGYFGIRGTCYTFIVLAAHAVTIERDSEWAGAPTGPSPRLVKLGGTVGTQVANTGVIGSSIEIYLVEDNTSTVDATYIGYRWLIKSEVGTWTLSGTPAATSAVREVETVS